MKEMISKQTNCTENFCSRTTFFEDENDRACACFPDKLVFERMYICYNCLLIDKKNQCICHNRFLHVYQRI